MLLVAQAKTVTRAAVGFSLGTKSLPVLGPAPRLYTETFITKAYVMADKCRHKEFQLILITIPFPN